MRGIAIATVMLVGCSADKASAIDSGHVGGDGPGSGFPDADISDAPPALPDALEVARPMYALSGADLYAIDLVANTSTLVGPITSAGVAVPALNGLGFDGGNLIGLDSDASNLLVIDPTTAAVTASRALVTPGLGGLTVIPANEIGNPAPLFLAASGDTLYQITPLTGAVTPIGTFSDGASFSSDLAWLRGHGLYITLKTQGSNGTPSTSLVQIDPTSAATIANLRAGYTNINGLSGYHLHLWGVSVGGNVYAIDPTTGVLMQRLTGGPSYTEAAQ